MKGDEADLLAVMTPEQHDDWQARGLIEGNWDVDDDNDFESPNNESPKVSELEGQLIEALLPHAGEAGDSEGAVECIRRIIRERDAARTKLDDAVSGAQTSEAALHNQIAELQTKLDQDGPSTAPADPFALVKLIGIDAAGNLIKAGYDTVEKVGTATDDELGSVSGIGKATVEKIRGLLKG